MKQKANALRAVPLESVLKLFEAQPDRYDKSKWHTSQGTISVTGTKFMNWNRGQGGGGAIDLVIHLNGFGFKEALAWLEAHFPSFLLAEGTAAWNQASVLSAGESALPTNPKWQPPWPDPTRLRSLKAYLLNRRGLPAALVEELIQSGRLYADARANAVFVLLARDHTPVGAELRGTTPRPWHAMAPGSRKDLGFFSVPDRYRLHSLPPSEGLILCESAIDAISCSVLHPHHGCLSTAGARSNPSWLAALIEEGYRIYCGFDADPTGEAMASAMSSLHPTVRRLRPSRHDWNDLLTPDS